MHTAVVLWLQMYGVLANALAETLHNHSRRSQYQLQQKYHLLQ
jgi:hypothetical protein